MQYYLGIDIGTTATKAVAFTSIGEIITSETVHYGMHHPQPGWSEQDPNKILQAVSNCLNKVVSTLAPQAPSFLSFSAAMHSIIAVDKKGDPLSPSIIWADNRAGHIAEALRNTEEGKRFYNATGVPVHSMSPLCKLLWLKQHQPTVFKTAYKFIGIKEYVFFKLFHTYIVDTSIASATGLLNLQSLAWDEVILEYLDIRTAQLAEVVATKHVIKYEGGNALLSLPAGTPVVIGGSDGALSNIGTVPKASNALVATIGTSGAVRRIVDTPKTDAAMRTFCYHVKDHQYIIGGATNNGAVVLQWLKESLLKTNESYDELFEQAERVAPGSEGLLLLPYLLGERAPIWNAQAKGVLYGLQVQHGKAHIVRAAMEGVIYCLYSICHVLFEEQEVSELYATGGFARSKLWLQIMADVFNCKVLVSNAVESAALGAVVIGAETLNISCDIDKKVEAVYFPNPASSTVYQKGFEKFQRLYTLLEKEMRLDS